MLAKLLVQFYFLVHGKLGLPGAGWLIRAVEPLVPGLRAYPLRLPDLGTITLDFRDETAFGILNISLGDFGDNMMLFRHMERFLGPGKVLWDIGANVGFMSMYFARPPHRLAGIHAFEPTPVALKPLQSLFSGHPIVHVHPVGLGDKDQQLEMNMSSRSSSLSSLVRPLPGSERITLSIRRGDTYRQEQQIPPPDFIKVDVEGYEPQVLAGLRETITAHRPAILFEHGFLDDETVKSMVPPGYRLSFILPDGSLTPDFQLRKTSGDALLIPDEKAHEAPENGRQKT